MAQGGQAPHVGVTTIGKTRLAIEAQRGLRLTRTIGRRLINWLEATKRTEVTLLRTIGRDPETGIDITEPVLDLDGKQVIVPVIPDDGFRKNWDLYERSLRNLLAEQRAREQMARASGAVELSDAEFEARLRELAEQAIREMPRDELERVLAARKLTIITASAETREPPPASESNPSAPGVARGDTPDLFDFSDGGDDDAG